MKKNVKVISINGLRGVIFAIFIAFCLFCGFIITPSFICSHLWNLVAENYIAMPQMTLLHGALLWGIIALSVYAICKNKISFGIATPAFADEQEIQSILEKVKESATQIDQIKLNKQQQDSEEKELEEMKK